MSLMLICCECRKTISDGLLAHISPEELDMIDEVYSIGKIIGYTGQISTDNMKSDTNYPEPLICGECLSTKLPVVYNVFKSHKNEKL